MKSPLRLALILAALLAPAASLAAPVCAPPAGLAPAPVVTPPAGEVQSGVTIAYYLLALNWTPEWCRTVGQGTTAQAMECQQPFGFTLHGLWPNGHGKPYPRYCAPVGGIDPVTVRRMYCRTPSAELQQHEWQAHGACGWTRAQAYFAREAQLYDRIRMPRIEAIAPLTAGAVRRAFVARNPWLRPAGIMVQTDRDQRLTEVRLCYDLKFRPMACEGGNGAPDGVRLTLTPSHTRSF